MIRFLSAILLFLIGGCAPSHFIYRNVEGVSLYLDIPEAEEVLFVSSLDSFQAHPAKRNSKGVWVVNDLADQKFNYFYIVDNRPYAPECRYSETDDFGSKNCIYQP